MSSTGPAEVVANPEARRLLRYELLVVMAIFPLPYVLTAVVSLVNSAVNPKLREDRFPVVITGHQGLSLPFDVMLYLLQLAAPALVLYLLRRSGEGSAAIGLSHDRRQLRGDAALLLPVFGAAFFGPLIVVQVLLRDLGIHGYNPSSAGLPPVFSVAVLVAGLQAGIVEEIVVLGYLIRRLEQLGFRTRPLIAVAVAVRVSYHVYYGWGVIAFVIWATVSVLLYRRYRRLWPFIVVHVLWDCVIGMSSLFGGWVVVGAALVLFPTTAAFTGTWWGSVERGN